MYWNKYKIINKKSTLGTLNNIPIVINDKKYNFNMSLINKGNSGLTHIAMLDIEMVNVEINNEWYKDGIDKIEDISSFLAEAAIPYILEYMPIIIEGVSIEN